MMMALRLAGTVLGTLMAARSARAQQSNVIDDLFAPFSGIDIASTYDEYSSLIDFIIYAILFTGLSQATLGKRFDSRGGRAMVGAIAMVLSLGLSISEATLGFNLRSFGPLAAGLFIFLVGFTLFLAIRTSGVSATSSGSIAFVVTYFSIRAIAPGFFDWMMANRYTSWIHALLLIAVMISTARLIKALFGSSDTNLAKEAKQLLSQSVDAPKKLAQQIRAEKDEKDFIKAHLEKVTKVADKTSKQMLEELGEVRKIIEQFGSTARGRFLVAKKLETLAPKEHEALRCLQKIQETIQRVSKFDHQHYHTLRTQWNQMSAEARGQVEAEMRDEWQKIKAEDKIQQHEKHVTRYDQQFRHAIHLVTTSLRVNRQSDALSWMDEAIVQEKSVQKILHQIKKLEDQIEHHLRREIHHEKRQAHALDKAKKSS